MDLRSRSWLLLASVLVAGAAVADPGGEMRKDEAKPPVFVAATSAAPGPELDAWLAAHADAHVKLPFTVWRTPLGVEHAAIGVHDARPPAGVKLSDTALGIALPDRLRALCGDEERCVVWLSGRFGALVPSPAPETTFSVFAVHERVTEERPWVEVYRAPSCLAVRTLIDGHCARGPDRCAKCRAAAEKPPSAKLLDVCPEGDHARPVIATADGTWHAYDVVRTFPDEAAARAFADEHGVTDVDLGR